MRPRPRPRTRRARVVRRVLTTLLVLVVVLALAVGGTVAWVRGTASPQVEGTIEVTGPRGPVTITRDAWGVPHIRAARSDDDAIFALGFVHWQDRAWQMEFQRRVADGRLAEMLGEGALAQDRFLRTVDFRRAAESALPALSKETRATVAAYTAGVNAAMQAGGLEPRAAGSADAAPALTAKTPPEFRLLRHTPEVWTDVDSISWSKLMAYDLGGNYENEIMRYRVASTLGDAAIDDVLPPYASTPPTILSDDELAAAGLTTPARGASTTTTTGTANAGGGMRAGTSPRAPAGTSGTSDDPRDALKMENRPGLGSNDWVVSGARTRSGKPLLADDPHLGLTSPMLWYLADVHGPTLHAIGASIPGLPSIVIGRNDRIAWGVTNVNPDVQDLIVEPASAKLTQRVETIHVKGGADVRLSVATSENGPIISDVGAKVVGPRVALRWTVLQPGDTTMDAFVGVTRARDWGDFTTALRGYVAPSQNFVYADVDGHTGYYAPGRVPIRSGYDGSRPVPGDGRHTWTGYIPFEKLPHAYDPADGMVVTANNAVTTRAYPYHLTGDGDWSEPDRAARITALLTDASGAAATPRRALDVAAMERIQNDVTSPVWPRLRDALLATTPDDDLSRFALDRLRAWDGKEDTNSVGASIFEAWLAELENMADDELGDPGPQAAAQRKKDAEAKGTTPDIPRVRLSSTAVQRALDGRDAHSPSLCADAAEGRTTCAQELTATLHRATAVLREKAGEDPDRWTWGRLHEVDDRHRAFAGIPVLGRLFGHRAPSPGGTNTVNVGRPEEGTFDRIQGPSYRQIVDLANPDASVYVGTLGQGGSPFAPHADDQMPLWLTGRYIPMSTRLQDWGETRTLTLAPRG